MIYLLVGGFLLVMTLYLFWTVYRRVRKDLEAEIRMVPEEERWVIYRSGKFHRLVGPGRVEILKKRPDFPSFEAVEYERVARIVNVRNEPVSLAVDGLFIYGIPFQYTVNFWCKTDIGQAAALTGQDVTTLVQFSDPERRHQVAVKLRDAMHAAVQQVQVDHPLPEDANFVDKLLPIFPGVDQCNELLSELRQQLMATLPLVGVLFDPKHPITVVRIGLANEMVNSFSRERTLTMLRKGLPEATVEDLMQMLSAIEGIDLPRVTKVLVEDGTGHTMRKELRVHEDGTVDMRFQENEEKQSLAASAMGSEETERAPEVNVSDDGYHLQPGDYGILKRVPPAA
jgi:hypothetical protein